MMSRTSATPEQVDAALQINSDARLRALKLTFLLLTGLGLLAFVPAGRLPGRKPGGRPVAQSALRSERTYPSQDQGDHMRYVYMALIAILAAVIILFKVQNLESVTVSLFAASVTLPVSVLVLLIYVLGMLTGGFLLALVRSWVHGATRRS